MFAVTAAYHRCRFTASVNLRTATWSFFARTAGSTEGSVTGPADPPARAAAACAASRWVGASSAAAVATPTRATLVAVTSRPDPIARTRSFMRGAPFTPPPSRSRPGARRRQDGFERERKPQKVSQRAFRTTRLPVGRDHHPPECQNLEEFPLFPPVGTRRSTPPMSVPATWRGNLVTPITRGGSARSRSSRGGGRTPRSGLSDGRRAPRRRSPRARSGSGPHAPSAATASAGRSRAPSPHGRGRRLDSRARAGPHRGRRRAAAAR